MEHSIDKIVELHERTEMERLVSKMLEAHALEKEVEAEVDTCGIWYRPKWHIFGVKNFKRVAAVLGETFTIEPFCKNAAGEVRDYKCHFDHRGLHIFCLATEKELHDGNEAH